MTTEPAIALPPDWRTRLQAWASQDAELIEAATWFDGAVLLELGESVAWLKIYAGRVIDVRDSAAVFGYTFALRGPAAVWQVLLVDPHASVHQLVLLGKLRVDGNQLEFSRLSKLVAVLVRGLRAVRAS
ncbi:MAG TPA: hypothetical protein VFQ53_11005 [Kofleriaceae bacterium]|nr:hypothetical protein [Kofleriaceae bacterium]